MKRLARFCAALVVTFAAVVPTARAHWPGQPEHQMAQLGDLKLESGEVQPEAYTQWRVGRPPYA